MEEKVADAERVQSNRQLGVEIYRYLTMPSVNSCVAKFIQRVGI